MTAHDNDGRVPVPSDALPKQVRRRLGAPSGVRAVRQIEAIDAWNTARRVRERRMDAACRSRLNKEVAKRERDALQRTHQAISACAANDLARQPAPMVTMPPTAVIAHRHTWLAQRVATLLEALGVSVIVCTDNGADALGAVVAEQPDIVLAGHRLLMMPGDVLLSQTRLFAPGSLRAVQVDDPQQARAWHAEVDAVFLRHDSPAHVADGLGELCRAAGTVHATSE